MGPILRVSRLDPEDDWPFRYIRECELGPGSLLELCPQRGLVGRKHFSQFDKCLCPPREVVRYARGGRPDRFVGGSITITYPSM
ncbi:hypothetical protein J6590_052108 [Homalodisca vitripennis]|nr:hypothetical protein J6590_052108 [Homalodisca vitripennis]